MTPKQIKRKRLTIEKHLDRLETRLLELRDACPHTSVSKTYKSNTGNYDPGADSYWISFHCPDCDKRWQEDQ